MVGGISMDEVDPEKELSDLFPGAGALCCRGGGRAGVRARAGGGLEWKAAGGSLGSLKQGRGSKRVASRTLSRIAILVTHRALHISRPNPDFTSRPAALAFTGLGQYVEALREMGADKMEDLAYLRRSDLQDLDMEIHPTDKKKLLELGLVAFLTKEGLAEVSRRPQSVCRVFFVRRSSLIVRRLSLVIRRSSLVARRSRRLSFVVFGNRSSLNPPLASPSYQCVAYIRSVGVDMVDDLVYLKQSDVALMDLKQEYKDKLMEVLGRES